MEHLVRALIGAVVLATTSGGLVILTFLLGNGLGSPGELIFVMLGGFLAGAALGVVLTLGLYPVPVVIGITMGIGSVVSIIIAPMVSGFREFQQSQAPRLGRRGRTMGRVPDEH